jgi:dipeptidyl aminopeptidase/acylaminoacyl peptidase
MKKMLLVVAIVLIAGALQSQTADFRAAEKFSSQNLTPKIGDISVNARWIEESDIFWYSYKTTVSKNYYYVDAAKKTKNLLFDSRYLASEIHKLVHKPYNELDLPLRSLEFEKKSTTKFTFELDSVRFLYDMTTMQLTIKDTLKKEPRVPSWISYSPDSTWIVFARNHNLFLMKKGDKDSVEIQLTTDGIQYFSFAGDASDTTTTKRVRARVSWFKNSEKFYVMRSDVRKVKDLFVIDVLAQPRPKLETYRYAMPGEEFVPQPELVVFDPATKGRVDVDLKKWKDQTISVAWTSQKSADKMIVTRKDRALKNMEVCSVNANTGEVKVLFSDQIHPYFNNDYSQLSVLNEGNDIIYWSEKTGWGQLYLYDGNGTLKNQITNGYFVTGRIERIDTLGRMIYFEGFGREQGIHPYYSIKYKASIDRGGMVQLTKEPANHSFSMSKSNKYFVSTYSTVDKAPKSVLRDNNGNILLELETTDLTELYKTGWKEPETIVLKAKDGVTNLYGVMYKPFNFDPKKKYPVISYVYPGPQTESVPYSFTVSGVITLPLHSLDLLL